MALHRRWPPCTPGGPVPPPIASCPSLLPAENPNSEGQPEDGVPLPMLRRRGRTRDQPRGCSEVPGGMLQGPWGDAPRSRGMLRGPRGGCSKVPGGCSEVPGGCCGARELRFTGVRKSSVSHSGGTAFGFRRTTPRPHYFRGESCGGRMSSESAAGRGTGTVRGSPGDGTVLGCWRESGSGCWGSPEGGGEALSPTAPSRRAS